MLRSHFGFAAVFLFTLGVFSYSKFTRSSKTRAERSVDKNFRKKIYRLCGLIIFACIALIAVLKMMKFDPGGPLVNWLFWLEAIAVWAFGVSWLVKGETIDYVKTRILGSPTQKG